MNGITRVSAAVLVSAELRLAGIGMASGTAQGNLDLDTGILHVAPELIPTGPPPPPNPPECIGLFPLPGVDPWHCVI